MNKTIEHVYARIEREAFAAAPKEADTVMSRVSMRLQIAFNYAVEVEVQNSKTGAVSLPDIAQGVAHGLAGILATTYQNAEHAQGKKAAEDVLDYVMSNAVALLPSMMTGSNFLDLGVVEKQPGNG